MDAAKENNEPSSKELLDLVKSLQSQLESLKQKKSPKKAKKKYKPRKKKVEQIEVQVPILQEDDLRVQRKVGFRKNLFNDTGELCKEDKDFDRKIKHQLISRDRPTPVEFNNKCSRCSRTYKSFTPESDIWFCGRCAKK